MSEPRNPLSHLTDSELESKLSSTEPLRGLVKQMPEDTVSLIWRADLNEKLRVHAVAPRKTWLNWAWRPAAALGLSALALTFWMGPARNAPNASGVEDAILTIHRGAEVESAFGSPLFGYAYEADNRPNDEWQISDLDLL
jgi:hypothetical protein